MRTPTDILMSGSGGDLQERRVALAAIVDPIQKELDLTLEKFSAANEFITRYQKELADVRATLMGNTYFYPGVPPLRELAEVRMGLIRSIHEIEAETAGLRALLTQMTEDRDFVTGERDGQRALIVKKDETLATIRAISDNQEADLEKLLFNAGVRAHDALALTPVDLADCVVVKRSEWERLQNLYDREKSQ